MTSEYYELGLQVQREIKGDDYVEGILSDTDEFSKPMRDLVTEYAWGKIWGRPGLDRRSRSILNIGVLAALNRPDALAMHLRLALVNGVTRDELQECLLQVAVYAGLPAGLASLDIARRVLAQEPD
jgi:4-carboxymuconolactone decarboxylase